MKNLLLKPNNKNIDKNFLILLILVTLILIIFTSSGNKNSANDGSRVATIESLVKRHTWDINNSIYGQKTIDKVIYNNHFYSDKPFALSLLGAGVYYILHYFVGLDFYSTGKANAYYWVTLIIMGGSQLLLTWYFYLSLKWLKIKRSSRLFVTSILVFGTLYLPYSTVLNNHTIAGTFLFISFYYYLKNKFKEGKQNTNLFLSGLFVSLAGVIDLFTSLPFLFIFFLLHWLINKKKGIILYIFGTLPFLLLQLFLNYKIFHTFFSIYLDLYFKNPRIVLTSYWLNPSGIDSLNHSKFLYLFNILFGIHGLLLYTPVLILSFIVLYKIIKSKNHQFFYEAISISFSFLIITLFYLLITNNYGGASYGFRYYIALTPLLVFFLAFYFQQNQLKYYQINLLFLLFLLSVLFSALGLKNIWVNTGIYIIEINKTIYFPLLQNLLSVFMI